MHSILRLCARARVRVSMDERKKKESHPSGAKEIDKDDFCTFFLFFFFLIDDKAPPFRTVCVERGLRGMAEHTERACETYSKRQAVVSFCCSLCDSNRKSDEKGPRRFCYYAGLCKIFGETEGGGVLVDRKMKCL